MDAGTLNWAQVLTIVGANLAVLMGFMGSTVALIIYGNKKMDVHLKSIADEMKDFHGRLERQDAEFKGKLLLMEERTRVKFYEGK